MLHRTFSANSQARLIELQQQLQGITKGGSTCAEYIQISDRLPMYLFLLDLPSLMVIW
jgi:hypothetical protein